MKTFSRNSAVRKDAAREFVRREARVLEARVFAVVFEEADPVGVVDALRAYRNPDGGFGHGLEPDKRCPHSLGLDLEVALDVMLAAGVRPVDLLEPAVEWLDKVADANGAVAMGSPVMEPYPKAEHWGEWTYQPGLNPTAGIVARLIHLGVEHPWIDRAGDWCSRQLAGELPGDAHALLESTKFLATRPNEVDFDRIRGRLPKLSHFRADAASPEYGVTPLHFASTPDSFWKPLFDEAQLEAHLDRLEADQQEDGGWAITWEPPSAAATLEYRGVVTIDALRTLKAYDRLA